MSEERRGFRRVLRIILRRRDADRAVAEEIAFHVEMTRRELEEQGMDPAAARAEAERRFGDRQTHLQAARRIARRNHLAGARRRHLQEAAQDLTFAWTSLRRRPLFTLAATLLLGLGVAAFSTVFSFMEAVLLRPLPLPEPQRIVRIERRLEDVRPGRLPFGNLNYDDIHFLQQNSRTLEGVAGMMAGGSLPLTGMGDAGRIPAARVTEGFFEAAGVFPRIGRVLTAADLEPGAERVVVISHGTWTDRFGSDPDILVRSMTLNWESYRVVGVMPPGFEFPEGTSVWAPLPVGVMGRFMVFNGIARLRRGADLEQATAEISGLLNARREADATVPAGGARLTPWHARMTEQVRPALLMLTGAALLVLLVVALNLGGLMVGRTAERQRELAVRRSLGAGEDRIRTLLIAESGLIGLAGGLIGLLIAGALLRTVVALSPTSLPFREAVHLDAPVLLIALLASLLSGLLAGLFPARQGRRSAQAVLRSRTTGSRGGGRRSGRLAVILQTAVATLLLVGAGLLVRSFWTALRVEPGMRVGNTLAVSLTLPRGRDWTDEERMDYLDGLRDRLVALPGVEEGALSLFTPLRGALPGGISLESGVDASQVEPTAYLYPVSPGYMELMGIPIVAGRAFRNGDDEKGGRVAIVDREAARQYWPGRDPVGSFFYGEGERYRIVGVAGETRQNGLLEERVPIVFVPFRQFPFIAGSIVLRTRRDPAGVITGIREAISSEDPDLVLDDISSLSDTVWQALAGPRFYTVLVGTFGLLALLLATAGLYAVVLLGVRRRQFEFGVRAALGARPGDNLQLVLRQGVLMGGVGVLLGAAAGFPLTRVLQSVLYGVEPMDPLSACVAAGLMLAAVVGASLTPAVRAARTDPVVALRSE